MDDPQALREMARRLRDEEDLAAPEETADLFDELADSLDGGEESPRGKRFGCLEWLGLFGLLALGAYWVLA